MDSPLKKFWRFLNAKWARPGGSKRPLSAATLKKLVQGAGATRPDELTCDECFEQLDAFAELVLAGKSAAEARPLVQDHLDHCHECREEFEALLVSLRAIS
jgi:hypothetical protein